MAASPMYSRPQALSKPQNCLCLAAAHGGGSAIAGSPTHWCCSLFLPLGGRLCAGLRARPYFAAREEMALQLPHLAAHCQDMWLKRLRVPARLWPAGGERFLMDHFPRPPEGEQALLLNAGCLRCAPAQGVPLAAPPVHRGLGQGRGTVGAATWSTGHRPATGADACSTALASAAVPATRATSAVVLLRLRAPPIQKRRGPRQRVTAPQEGWAGARG